MTFIAPASLVLVVLVVLWLVYRLRKEVKLSRALEAKLYEARRAAAELYEQNNQMLGILGGNRQTRRAATAEARKALRN